MKVMKMIQECLKIPASPVLWRHCCHKKEQSWSFTEGLKRVCGLWGSVWEQLLFQVCCTLDAEDPESDGLSGVCMMQKVEPLQLLSE